MTDDPYTLHEMQRQWAPDQAEAAARLGYDPARLTVTSATALIGELKELKRKGYGTRLDRRIM